MCNNTCIDASSVEEFGSIGTRFFGPAGVSITGGVIEVGFFRAQLFGPIGVCFCADGRWVRLANERAMEIRGPIGANIVMDTVNGCVRQGKGECVLPDPADG